MPASKLFMMQQSHLKDSLLSANDVGAKTTMAHTNGQSNGTAKIVLVSNETMEIDSRNHCANVTTSTANDEELTSLTWLQNKNLLKGMHISCPPNIKHISSNGAKVIGDSITIKAQPMISSSKSSSPGAVTPTSDFVDDSGVSEDNASSVNSGSEHGGDTYPHIQPPPASSIIHLSPGGTTVIEYKTKSPQKINSSNTSNAIIRTSSNGNCSVIASTVNSITKAEMYECRTVDSSLKSPPTPHTHFHKRYIKQMNALNSIDTTVVTVSTTPSISVHSSTTEVRTISQPATIHAIPMPMQYAHAKYEHGTVIVENDHSHHVKPIMTIANHHIVHHDDDRHSDEYITPISSPRLQSQPSAPQKLASVGNGSLKTPPVITMTANATPASPLSPNSSQQNPPKPGTNGHYDPFLHTFNKPPLSFSSLIFLAIEDASEKALPVKEIYAWIVKHYPYFKTAPTGWKNSVRHNLSLNKCFQKVEKAPNMGKGSLWRVEQQYKQNLIIALTRSSYHPNTAAMEKATASLKNQPRSPESSTTKSNKPIDAELFPRLSKFMANMQNGGSVKDAITVSVPNDKKPATELANGIQNTYQTNSDGVVVITTTTPTTYEHGMHMMSDHEMDVLETQRNIERIARDWGVDSIDDVNAATAMLALKHGPKVFAETFQAGTPIITSVPSEDHTYSAGGSSSGSSGASSGSSTVANTPSHKPSNALNNTIIINDFHAQPESTAMHTPPHDGFGSNKLVRHASDLIDNRHSDNVSNGTSSDAAYESSEEGPNAITDEELARRHQEGVDAFLSFASEVSSMSSPLKRPPSADYVHHYNHDNDTNNNNNQRTHSNNNTVYMNNNNNNHSNGTFYYDSGSSPSSQYLSSPSPPKKSRTLRTKLKKKAHFV